MKKVDMHLHTTFSDGMLSLEELLHVACAEKIEEIAITDHDTIINIKNYGELAKRYEIKIIPGIELSVSVNGMHILGYGILNFDYIENYINNIKKENYLVCVETIELLQKNNIDISLEKVEAIKVSETITKRDIARYLVNAGYAKTNYEVYQRYIGKNQYAYVPIHKITPEEALSLIINSGGVSVLAHPYTLDCDTDFDNLIPYMKEKGLLGIETNTIRHTTEQKKFFESIAKKYELFETAGTDFHRFADGIMPGVFVSDDFLDKFYELIKI